MRSLLRKVGQMGWLPIGQLCSVLITTAGFAVLSRTLGPAPFAEYAVAIFFFTLGSLVTDLSPQGVILVNAGTYGSVAAAQRVAAISAGLTAVVCGVGVYVALWCGFGTGAFLLVAVLMAVAAGVQMLSQVPRAKLILASRFKAIAGIDALSTLLSVAVAVAVSYRVADVAVLAAQLAVLGLVRLPLLGVLAGRSWVPREGTEISVSAAMRYGIRVLPLNVAAYLSRSLDSGLLPFIIPAAAAATYSRSYQVVVSPVAQAQQSLGGVVLARLSRSRHEGALDDLSHRLWVGVVSAAGVVGALLGALALPVSILLFGPAWPMPQVFVAGMACAVPALAVTVYLSWHLQLVASAGRSVAHLSTVVIAPILALGGGILFGTQGALFFLVVGSALTPCLLIAANRRVVFREGVHRRAMVQSLGAWALPAAVFAVTAWLAGFWTYSF